MTTPLDCSTAPAFAGVLLVLDELPLRVRKLVLPACGIKDTEQNVDTIGEVLQRNLIDANPNAAEPDKRPWLVNGKDMKQFQQRVQRILADSSCTAALNVISEYNNLLGVYGELNSVND